MKNRKLFRTMATLAGVSLIALSAYTIQAEDSKKDGVCRADRERLCGDVEKGKGRVRLCMKQKKDQLSNECREHMEKRMALQKKLRSVCKVDHKKYCKKKKRKDGRKCMIENKSKFSATCQAAMSEMEALWKKQRNRK